MLIITANQRRLLVDKQKRRCVFVDDESGEGWQLIGDLNDKKMAARNALNYVQVAIDELEVLPGDVQILSFKIVEMTDDEIDALPAI